MKKVCYICNTEMEKKTTKMETGWGKFKLTVDGVNSFVCPKCGEVILEAQEVQMLQKLSRSLGEAENDNKPDLLNLTEVADLLRVSNQTIYNKIKDGKIKAHKFGREWRFVRKDIEVYMNGEEPYSVTARSKSKNANEEEIEIIKKYL